MTRCARVLWLQSHKWVTPLSFHSQVKAAICEDVNLLLEKSEDEFAPYLRGFATAVWQQLMAVGPEPAQDALATEAIRFLTTIVSGVHHALFAEADTLRRICENIIIPNLQFRAVDEELFDDNCSEYIRRDMEGSDADTRRRGACELLRALTAKFRDTITAAVSGYVGGLLAEYAAAPGAAWKQKDAAIYLVIALTVRGKTEARGATSLNELVNVVDFFNAQLLPELQAPLGVGSDVIRADALKFVTTFRQQLPKPVCASLLPCLARLLGCEQGVVHSYAALALERLLTVRDGPALRFAPADLLPARDALLGGLFGALGGAAAGEDNEYVMKALMRLLASLGPHAAPVAASCVGRLAGVVGDLARNPRAPTFAHYTYEALAVLVRASVGDAESAAAIEALLFPPFQAVLQADVTELAPYTFQVLSQLIELRPAPLPAPYLALFPPLLAPVLWERPGNVPALVRLLQAYLARAPAQVLAGGHLSSVLGVFQRLNASRTHDHEGFFVLNSLVEFLDADAWGQHLPAVWGLLLQRLQNRKTVKYARSFAVFLALLIARHGPAWTQAGLDAVQAGLFPMLIEHVWLPALPAIGGDMERRMAAVAGAKLLTDCAPLAAPDAQQLWGRLLEAVVALLTEEAEEPAGAAEEEEIADNVGGTAYARLMSAARPETEPVPEARNAAAFVTSSLARLAAQQPGRLPQKIANSLPPVSVAALIKLCADNGVVLA